MKFLEENFEVFRHPPEDQTPRKLQDNKKIVVLPISSTGEQIRLRPEQIEEINHSDYTLKLFHATRVEKLTVKEIIKQFGEPTPGHAQVTMDRYVEIKLVYKDEEGKYYSYYPNHYVNYSHYRFDKVLEKNKDAEVFDRMKTNTGDKQYWSDQTYFSMDGFMTRDQSLLIKKELEEIKEKAKRFAEENRMKGKIEGLSFRRFKFYDIKWIFVLMIMAMSFVGVKPAQAGNDPTAQLALMQFNQILESRGFETHQNKVFLESQQKFVKFDQLVVTANPKDELKRRLLVKLDMSDLPGGDGSTESGHDPTVNGGICEDAEGNIIECPVDAETAPEACEKSEENCHEVVEMISEEV